MLLKIIGAIAVVICGAVSFFAKRILNAVEKDKVTEQKVTSLKLIMLLLVMVGAALVILPDYIM